MRINLTTPFSEKDQVKALGARWDAAKKLWYIQDVADLEPFQRWIPSGATKESAPDIQAVTVADPAGVAGCGCDVLPWDDCVHTTTTQLRLLFAYARHSCNKVSLHWQLQGPPQGSL